MQVKEIPLVFDCRGDQLIGILHQTKEPANMGVLLVVGGPQYRVGSHRQFVLLARHLAAQGIPVMRFDVRGMGDSTGEPRRFSQIDDDIGAAVDCLLTACPDLQGVVLWGLCDGASAALFYAYQDSRVKGLVLLNPWVFTEQGAAKTYLKHYYLQRLASADFWRKVFSLRFDYGQSLVSLLDLLRKAGRSTENRRQQPDKMAVVDESLALPVRMRECLKRFDYSALLILSGRDLTADEFRDVVENDADWQALLSKPSLTRQDFPEADHTFSSAVWRDQVAIWTANWIKLL